MKNVSNVVKRFPTKKKHQPGFGGWWGQLL
jgi:hypothetical protein